MKNAFFNRIKILFLSLMCIFCSICFFACTNLISSDDSCSDGGEKNSEEIYEIKGNLFVEGSAPKIMEKISQARSVSATVPDTVFYSVVAKNAGNSEKTYTAEIDGSTFSIKLKKGTWNITAEGFFDAEKTVSVLKGSASVSVENENSVKSGISIKMLPQKDGEGNISLSIEAEIGSGIKSVLAELVKNDEGSSVYSENLNFSSNAAKIEKSDIPSGVYVLSLKFYSEDSGFGELLYTAQEIVNIFNNLTTDTWQGNSVYFNGGKFVVSKSAVESFKMNTFFVQGENETTYSPVKSASDNNAGTYFAPFATVQAAVDKINAINDGSTEYTVFVDGAVTADTNYGNYAANNSSFVNISPNSTLNLTIKSLSSEKAVVDAGRNTKDADITGWRVFYISSKADVVFENITIKGGSLDSAGGGISCDGNLTLKNCIVTENKSNNAGGGISFSGKELVLESTSVTYNESSGNGGGIDAVGKVTISESKIINNSATDKGGGIYFGNGEKTISTTTVNRNSAVYGGGIYMQDGTLNLESGAIIGEKLDPNNTENDISKVATEYNCGNLSTKKLTNSGDYDYAEGAGIHVAAGKVNMYDGAYICRNYTECSGGGIFIKSGGTFNMEGGTVGWNYSNYGSGIRCDGNLEISGNSIICYNKVSTQNAQGFCGRGAGITINGGNNAEAKISGDTKIFENLAVRAADSATNTDAMGAGIYCSGKLEVTGGEIYKNSSDSDGPAIAIENGTATLSGCEIYDNKASRYGGAIFVNRTAANIEAILNITINEKNEKVQIHNNQTSEQGGAIYIGSGTATISGCEIYENHAKGAGGAIFVNTNSSAANAQLTIKEKVLIKENHADEGDGGAIYATINTDTASGKEVNVTIGDDKSSENIKIIGNYAKRGGAFYGENNARFVMNAGEVLENYSTEKGGGAMYIWGGNSNYSTFTMNGGKISGNMAKNGCGGAVHIDHGSGGMAAFIMKGGLLSGNKATGTGSKLGGAIYLQSGGKIELSGSAVIAVEDDGNDVWLAEKAIDNKEISITIIGTLAPGNNAADGKPKYTARITPQTYNVGISLITADSGVALEDEVGKFRVTGNDDSDEWFIIDAGKLSKPTAISSLSSAPDFKLYPKLTVSTASEMNKLSGFVNNGNTMAGTTVTLLNDITLGSDFQKIGNTDKPFSGTFDGNGKKIDSGTASLWAIFYQVTGGTIKNLTSSGKFSMSGIVANLSNNGLIENCTNTATVTSDTYSPLGGVCAKMEDSVIDRCVNKGSVKLEKSGESLSLALGGICGSATGVIKNSTNYDSVVYTETSSNDSCFVGGILGTTTINANINTELYNCINIGDVSGNEASGSGIGGILGDAYIFGCSVSMQNCVNMGNSSKNAIAGKCVGTSKDKTKIDFTYYLEYSAPSVFAWSHANAKAYLFKKRDDLYKTSASVTVGTFSSDDLIELLNAWVTANSSDTEKYLQWNTVDGNPSLVYE